MFQRFIDLGQAQVILEQIPQYPGLGRAVAQLTRQRQRLLRKLIPQRQVILNGRLHVNRGARDQGRQQRLPVAAPRGPGLHGLIVRQRLHVLGAQLQGVTQAQEEIGCLLAAAGQRHGNLQRQLEIVNGFRVGIHLGRGPAGQRVIVQGARRVARLGKVARQHRRQLGRVQPRRVSALQRLAHHLVQHPPVGPHQRLVSRLLNQRMPEQVFNFRIERRQQDQAAGLKGGQFLGKRHAHLPERQSTPGGRLDATLAGPTRRPGCAIPRTRAAPLH